MNRYLIMLLNNNSMLHYKNNLMILVIQDCYISG